MNAREEIKKARTVLAQEVITYLNEQAGRKFHYDTRGISKLFTAEWSHKYGIKQYKGVIDYLVMKWKDDLRMRSYLRPKTLFGPEKFPEYLDEARALIMAERKKHRLISFKEYNPVNKAYNNKLLPFKQYDPHTQD